MSILTALALALMLYGISLWISARCEERREIEREWRRDHA